MLKRLFTRSCPMWALLFVIILAVAGCSQTGEDTGNLPQSEDMAILGESEYIIDAALAVKDGDPEQVFEDYADQYLSLHKLVERDGTIKKGGSFSVDYKKLPDFKSIKHIPDRKQAFFDYLRPAIEYQNQVIRERRQLLKGIAFKVGQQMALSAAEQRYMLTMRERYRVDEAASQAEAIDVLLRRVDTLPVSMVLAQAAIESAWGTSRFAREANNLFGQWCFSKGCGLVPARRGEGKIHEVRKFSSVDKAIGAYFLNINSFPTYAKTRQIRDQLRSAGKPLTGHALVAGLEQYSARGEAYIKELRSMIRSNKLEQPAIKST